QPRPIVITVQQRAAVGGDGGSVGLGEIKAPGQQIELEFGVGDAVGRAGKNARGDDAQRVTLQIVRLDHVVDDPSGVRVLRREVAGGKEQFLDLVNAYYAQPVGIRIRRQRNAQLVGRHGNR